MDQEANGAAHGFAIEEERDGLEFWVLLDGVEEGEAVADNVVDVGNKSPETLGATMALEVESEGGEAHLGEENRGGLESPADVVAIAVDHADDGTWRGGEGLPGSGEEGEAPWGGVKGAGGMNAMGGIVILLCDATPVVRKVLHPSPLDWG